MALTSEGKRLTEAHRKQQILLSTRPMAKAKLIYGGVLNVADLDRSSLLWSELTQQAILDGYMDSMTLAAAYMDRYTMAEIGSTEQIVTPAMDRDAVATDLRINGPVAIKKKIGQGIPPEEAKRQAMSSLLMAVQQQVLAGGRDLIDKTVRYSGSDGRYRRVTDGKPCAFCAMLAGRGPVYSEETSSFRSHRACGCTAEQVFGDWVPTDREALWRASYKQAAMDADDAGEARLAPSLPKEQYEDTILYRMRRNAPELFSDGVLPKEK